MSLTLRVRHRDGTITIPDINKEATVADLQKLIAAGTGVAADRQLLKCGVPPVQLSSDLGHAVKLLEVGIGNRDMVIVEERTPSSGSSAGSLRTGATGTDMANCSGPSKKAGQAADSVRAAKKRGPSELHEGDRGHNAETDARARDILPAFDRAIAAASKNFANTGEDKHQAWAMRKGKAAVLESLKRGDNISLSALHTLPGVGHWVVQQVREHMNSQSEPAAKKGKGNGRAAPPPTPTDFTWWYLGRNNKPVAFRNDAEMKSSPTGSIFKVSIMHASGRQEIGWLPDARAPPEGPESSKD